MGNKSDLHDQRSIPLAYGTRRADDLGCEYFTETSAHNDINSIKTLFNEICKRVVQKKLYSSSNGFSLKNY